MEGTIEWCACTAVAPVLMAVAMMAAIRAPINWQLYSKKKKKHQNILKSFQQEGSKEFTFRREDGE